MLEGCRIEESPYCRVAQRSGNADQGMRGKSNGFRLTVGFGRFGEHAFATFLRSDDPDGALRRWS